MANSMIPRNSRGEMILPGRIRRERIFDFDGTAIPTGVTLGAGTAVYQASSAGRGAATFTTAATINANAQITFPSIHLADIEVVSLQLQGIRTVAATRPEGYVIELSASGLGAFMKRDANYGTPVGNADLDAGGAYIKRTGGASIVTVPFAPFPATRDESVDLGLMIVVPRKTVYAFLGDQIIGYGEFTDMNISGAITPAFQIITNTAAAKSFSIARAVLETRLS